MSSSHPAAPLGRHLATAWLAAGALLAAVLTTSCGDGGVEPGRPGPHGILLVSIDTLRADHLGCYGYARQTSPFLDELSGRGALFEQAIAASPWTLPSHASLLSGLSPSTHRAVEGSEAIAPSVALAAELFGEAGYRTGGFVASWFVSRRYGFDRGFQRFEDFGQTGGGNVKEKIVARRVVDEATAWLRENGQRPFFLFVHLYDPHWNFDPPPEHAALFDTGYRGPREKYRKYHYYLDNPLPADLLAHEIALYDGEIHYADAELRRLHGVLDQLGLAESVLTLVTADHGEEFFERGSWGHAHTLYDELMRVPLIVAGPGVRPGARLGGQVRHVDVLPTLLEAAGLPVPERLHGRSFWARLQAGVDPVGDQRPAFLESSRFETNLIGVRRGGWKIVGDLNDGGRLLFDLREDPGEEADLATERPETLAGLDEEMLAAAAALVPDRWMLRWFAQGEVLLEGRIETTGRFLLARGRGEGGEIEISADGKSLSYRLPPGGVAELAVMPVDAEVTVHPPRSGESPVTLAVGAEGRPAGAASLSVSGHDAGFLAGMPAPVPPAAAFWLEQSRGGGEAVNLTEEEIRALESLGYVQR
jgi:arylsulfatase A-like enzyme